jgi:hypothetical protein
MRARRANLPGAPSAATIGVTAKLWNMSEMAQRQKTGTWPMSPRRGREDLEGRIKEQFPALFVTLVSVLIGLALADVVAQARTRMVLWPLTLGAVRTWCQLSANFFSALGAWVVYAHIGVSRRRIPGLSDAFIAFSMPIILLIGNTFVGVEPVWPWFYFATVFLAFSFMTTLWLSYTWRSESEIASFRVLLRPGGFLSVFVSGVPVYAAAGWADQHHYLSPLLETLFAATATPAALTVCHLFLRDWHQAISEARSSDPE